jgi:hypothetical protein
MTEVGGIDMQVWPDGKRSVGIIPARLMRSEVEGGPPDFAKASSWPVQMQGLAEALRA